MQKLLVVWNAIVDPRSASEIAQHTGLAEQTVHNFISEYNRKEPEVFEKPGRGGRRNAYLTLEEEKELLAGFEPDGLTGRIATDAQIKAEFECRAGREVSRSTIYRMLARHGWRKLVPRPGFCLVRTHAPHPPLPIVSEKNSPLTKCRAASLCCYNFQNRRSA